MTETTRAPEAAEAKGRMTNAAPFRFIQAMLGLEARAGRLTLDPRIPDEIGRIRVSRVPAFGTYWDVEAIGANGQVRLSK